MSDSLNISVERLKRNFRWHDWAIDKIPILFGICFYLLLVNNRSVGINLLDFFVFLIFSLSSTVYGYTVNNFADLEIDKAQGKDNFLLQLSRYKQTVLLCILSIIVIVSGLYFISKPYFSILWFVQFFIATFYSLPPLRFKERGSIGLIIPFFAQLVLPTLICFAIFGALNSGACILFIIYALFKGGAYDIGHQFHDQVKDTTTETQTFAVQHGKRSVFLLFKIFLIMERFAFILLLLYLNWNYDFYSITNSIKPFLFLLIIYLLLLLGVFIEEFKNKQFSDPYYLDTRGLSNILHIIIPNIVFPTLLAFLLVLEDIKYILIFIFFIVWIFPTPSKLLWPLETILKVYRKARHFIRTILSKVRIT